MSHPTLVANSKINNYASLIYTRRIIDVWRHFFATGEAPRLSDATVPGFQCHPDIASAG